jgi:hypothetical protein
MPITLKDPLEASIKKWERNLKIAKEETGKPVQLLDEKNLKWRFGESKTLFTLGANTCPLCKLYIGHCLKLCPVAKRTGLAACNGTPYQKLEPFLVRNKIRTVTKGFIKLVEEEVEFLKSLRPENSVYWS